MGLPFSCERPPTILYFILLLSKEKSAYARMMKGDV